MSRRAFEWAWACRGLTPAVRCVLLALAEHADDMGRCWPSLSRLARLSEVDRRTVTRALAALEARGLLTRARGRQTSTTYVLSIWEADGRSRPESGDLRNGDEGAGSQGHETPRDWAPQGASDPASGGLVPWGRGVAPPDSGASGPTNRNKNLQRNKNEVSPGFDRERSPTPPTKGGKQPASIPPDWQPSTRVFDWAARQGMTRTWVQAQVDEFVVYWSETGEARRSWGATFMSRLQQLKASQARTEDDDPERGLADKDYSQGATPLDQIPWLDPATLR